MDVYTYRDILDRVNAAESQFPGRGMEGAMIQALLEQNSLLREVVKKLDYIKLRIEDLDEK